MERNILIDLAATLGSLYKAVGGATGAVSILVGLIALFGTLGGVIATYVNARRSVYISSITVERSKWIESLRKSISDYSAALGRLIYRIRQFRHQNGPEKSVYDSNEILEAAEQLNQSVSVVQLQLNPAGVIDKNILKLLDAIFVNKDTGFELFQRADELLIHHSQWLLKLEWETVKYEARGSWYRLFHKGYREKILSDYKTFTAAQMGNVQNLVEEFKNIKNASKEVTPPPSAASQ